MLRRMCWLRSTLLVASFTMALSSGVSEASTPSEQVPGRLLVRYARGGPSDGCGPNPLSKLAQVISTITGENLTAEDVLWHLQKDPYVMREMLALLQYHNCMAAGEGARF